MKFTRTILALTYLLTLSLINVGQINSFYTTESRLIIESEDEKGKSFNANTEYAYLTLNTNTGDFILNANLSMLNTGNQILDSILKSKPQQILSFKGNISENLFVFNQQINDEKDYDMQGVLTINSNSVKCIAQYDPLNFADKGDIKNYRMDFKLLVDPTNISILGLEKQIKNKLVIEVIAGKLNIITQ